MDWNAAIEKHRNALKGIVAALVAMATSPVPAAERGTFIRGAAVSGHV